MGQLSAHGARRTFVRSSENRCPRGLILDIGPQTFLLTALGLLLHSPCESGNASYRSVFAPSFACTSLARSFWLMRNISMCARLSNR